ncbi:MAG: DUF115 domain-containing protein [Magnetococcales bacterium]|nr:DUF115 domain-containing protein [Magnetococcales bacterium]
MAVYLHHFSNVSAEIRLNNIVSAVRRNYARLAPEAERPGQELLIVAGGPSMPGMLSLLRALHPVHPILAVNGAHDFLRSLDPPLLPEFAVMLDADPVMRGVMRHPGPETLYLMANQCDPEVLSALGRHRMLLWHVGGDTGEAEPFTSESNWTVVHNGCTGGLRAISLGMVLGYRRFHLFGVDSCHLDGKSHGYEHAPGQETRLEVRLGGGSFRCEPWMLAQALDFGQMLAKFPSWGITVRVHGPGLLAAMSCHPTPRLELLS